MQYSNKREKTKQRITEAFANLYEKYDISQITVRELCAKAGINRSTFYTYYNDVYELRDETVKGLVGELSGRIFSVVRGINDIEINTIVKTLAVFLKEHDYKPLILLRKNSDVFVNVLAGELQKRLSEMAVDLSEEKSRDLLLYARYHINGVIAVLDEWGAGDMTDDIDIIVGKIARLAEEGVLTVIKKDIMTNQFA